MCEIEISELEHLRKAIVASKPNLLGDKIFDYLLSGVRSYDLESQSLLDSWCSGKIDVMQFTSSFCEARNLLHRESIICEKIKQHNLYSEK